LLKIEKTSHQSIKESGGAGESHPHAPTDPYVSLSTHTAPASLPLEISRSQAYTKRTRFLPVSWLTFACCELAHPLRSSPITEPSSLILDDPPLCFASVLSFSWDLHLNFSLNIETTGCRVAQPLPAFALTDPDVRRYRIRLFPRVTPDYANHSCKDRYSLGVGRGKALSRSLNLDHVIWLFWLRRRRTLNHSFRTS
jgi:hypothetical protein